jgi:hypothetical protein
MSGNRRLRPNCTLSLTIAIIVAGVAAVIGSLAADKPAATERFYLRNTAGSVLFDHGRHQSQAESCAACHHDLYGSSVAVSCEECHGDDVEPADFDHAELKEYHSRDCSTCHEQTVDSEEAQSCRQCHPTIQENESDMVDCSQCHDDGYDADMLEHAELIEIEDHSCLGCHQPQSISESYHASCIGCHLEESPKKYANEDGTVNCGGCHLR